MFVKCIKFFVNVHKKHYYTQTFCKIVKRVFLVAYLLLLFNILSPTGLGKVLWVWGLLWAWATPFSLLYIPSFHFLFFSIVVIVPLFISKLWETDINKRYHVEIHIYLSSIPFTRKIYYDQTKLYLEENLIREKYQVLTIWSKYLTFCYNTLT